MASEWEKYQDEIFRKHRQRYFDVEENQSEELDDEFRDLQDDFEEVVYDYSSGDTVDESILGSKDFEIILVAGLASMLNVMAKHNQQVYRIGGDWGVDMVRPYGRPGLVSELETQVSRLTQRTGDRFAFRRFPADNKTVGSRIKTIEGSTLRGVQNLLAVQINEGRSAPQIAGALKNYIKKDDRRKWVSPFEWYRKRFGYKVGKPNNIRGGSLDYNVYRIARTEINYAWRDSSVTLHDGKDYLEGFDWVLSHAHPRPDICDDWAADGPYNSASDVPDGHANCMCSVVPRVKKPEDL